MLAANVEEERENGVSGLMSEEDGGDEQDASDPDINGLNIQVSGWDTSSIMGWVSELMSVRGEWDYVWVWVGVVWCWGVWVSE